MWAFFFRAEDGIRDYKVTGVQTCALPITGDQVAEDQGRQEDAHQRHEERQAGVELHPTIQVDISAPSRPSANTWEIGRASCRERGEHRREERGVGSKEEERDEMEGRKRRE